MSVFSDAIEVFEGGSKRILWLPVLAPGYTYYLTGFWFEFILAVSAIGGARMFSDLTKRAEESSEHESIWGIVKSFRGRGSTLKLWFVTIISVLYVVAAGYGAWRVYDLFEHTDPILVAMAGIYLGAMLIVLMNTDW